VPLDGRGGGRIVYASKQDENYDIYVMNADGSGQRRLTFHPAEDTDPAWSPDGTRIAFTSYRTGYFEIYVMNADGSNMRQLTHDGGWGPAWSPDGSLIAFTRFGPYGRVFVMNSDGSDQRQISLTTDEIGISNLDWSPDGTQMVCVVDSNPSTIASQDYDVEINLLNIGEILAGTAEMRFQPLPRVGDRNNDWPSWSPDGTRIVFSVQIGRHRDLYLVNVDGTDLKRLTLDDAHDEFAPTWSPDGTRIAFQSSAAGGWDIFSIRVDGTDLQRLTTDFANDVAPSWVP
jgi:Tol biopolymer transport system component